MYIELKYYASNKKKKIVNNYIDNILILASFEEGKEEPDGGSRLRRYDPMAIGRFGVRCRVIRTFNNTSVRPGQIFLTMRCRYLNQGSFEIICIILVINITNYASDAPVDG